MPRINLAEILAEDAAEAKTGSKPFRFGVNQSAGFSPSHSGTWENLPEGGRVWRLKIRAPEAQSIHLLLQGYRLPEGAELYFYDEGQSVILGAYTVQNNTQHGEFLSFPMPGEVLGIEYYEPAEVSGQGTFTIAEVIHGYKPTFTKNGSDLGFGNSGPCNINFNCPVEFQNPAWQRVKKSVAMILTCGGTRICTGTLVQNTKRDSVPYLLTADHCLCGSVNTWTFLFNYESPNCLMLEGGTQQTLQGCTLRANSPKSDFALVELTDKPQKYFDVHYAGWNRLNMAPDKATCIHHPSGDIKKVSRANAALKSTPYLDATEYADTTHWRVPQWSEGVTEPGSSGSALFNENYEIIGQLHGGKRVAATQAGATTTANFGILGISAALCLIVGSKIGWLL